MKSIGLDGRWSYSVVKLGKGKGEGGGRVKGAVVATTRRLHLYDPLDAPVSFSARTASWEVRRQGRAGERTNERQAIAMWTAEH